MVVLLLFFVTELFACETLGKISPVLTKKLKEYDAFVLSLQSEKDPLPKINRWIKNKGILLDAHISEKLVKNYPSAFADDSITGAHTLFLKNLKLPPGLSNDLIYEVPSYDSPKTIRSWQIPSNGTFLGIRGNEIFYRTYLGSPCSKIKRDILIAISPNGKFRAVADEKFPEPKYNLACEAVGRVYKKSEYGACLELKDINSRKKRIIIYQSPMT
jgi:hypothetical protein